MAAASIHIDHSGDTTVVQVTGDLVTTALTQAETSLQSLRPGGEELVADLSGLDRLDTGGAWILADLRARLAREGTNLRIEGASAEHLALIETVSKALPEEHVAEAPPSGFIPWLEKLGGRVAGGAKSAVALLNFVGLILSRLGRSLLQPWRLRFTALVSQMQDVGLNAVPIVALMGFLIGIVLAFQGSVQLRQFGAEVFVVDLIAVSVLRELGILLTAIIVAGRSGSAFTASIGSMKVGEEIDAMRTLGLDPVEVLILPRLIALMVMLPILGLIANFCALVGGALMAWVELGISPQMFMTRFSDNTSIWHLAVGVIKAPFFAFVIAVVGCWQALQVGGSSESVGQRTTISVVQSIFLVLVIDAAFSVFFSEMGI